MHSQIGPSDLEMYLYFTRLLKFQKVSLEMRSSRAGQIFCCVESNETNGLDISLVPRQERVEHITEIQSYLSSHTPHKAAFPAFSAIRKSTKHRGTWTLESPKPGWPSDPESDCTARWAVSDCRRPFHQAHLQESARHCPGCPSVRFLELSLVLGIPQPISAQPKVEGDTARARLLNFLLSPAFQGGCPGKRDGRSLNKRGS